MSDKQMNDYYVHPTSMVDDNVTIGKGTKPGVFPYPVGGAVIGENCSLGQSVNISNNVKIGNGVRIQNNVSVYEGVMLEDYVFCGPSMVFTNDLLLRDRGILKGVKNLSIRLLDTMLRYAQIEQ